MPISNRSTDQGADVAPQDVRALYQQQVNELDRLAAEAESCARLLRQEAQRHQRLLDAGELDEQQLARLLEEREALRFNAEGFFKVTEALM